MNFTSLRATKRLCEAKLKMNGRSIFLIFLCLCVLIIVGCHANIISMNERKMGYCFDAAYDPDRDRLYVAAGKAGLHIFDVVDGRLEYILTFHDDGYYRNIKIKDGRAFIADTERGLVVLDISKDTPVTKWIQGKVGEGLHIEEKTLFLAAGTGGFYIFDITNQDEPRLYSHVTSVDQPWDVWVHQGLAYLADINQGLVIIDVTSPAQPKQIGFLTWDEEDPMAEVVRGEGNYVYIASGRHGLVVVDVADPTNPVIVSKYAPSPDSFGEGLFVSDHIVYLAIGDKRNHDENGLHILDVSDPYSPKVLGKVLIDDWVEGVFVAGEYAFVTNTWSGVRVIDVQYPEDTSLVDHFASVPEVSN